MMTKLMLTFLLLIFYLTANAQSKSPPPIVRELVRSTGIHRTVFILGIIKYDSTLIVKEALPVNQLPNFVGKDNYNGSLQLIGNEYEIILAKWIFTFGADSVTKKGLMNMGYFAGSGGGQVCIDWLLEKILDAGRNHKRKFTEYKDFSDDLKGEISFDPKWKTLTLSFFPR